ncbi:MAG: prepilin-type N-terminal cleavage/methylation domain-containing protein [Planctomycetaceae bacterium]|nr:prepilin-type N-terminal cleavage/methylation domain-containing protein [Planctomycetaceae bacterium]
MKCRPQHRQHQCGFTLAEVVIVTVILMVLLSAVWSLFSLQQQTLERGQRLSRESRVNLAMRQMFQDDLDRTAATRWKAQNSQGELASPLARSVNSGDGFAGMIEQVASSSPPQEGRHPKPQFSFAGGRDWLIVDVRRPAHQLASFESRPATDPLVSGPLQESTPSTLDDELGIASDAIQLRIPTAFERVIYIWLSDEEVEAVTGLLFGHDDAARVASGGANLPEQTKANDDALGGGLTQRSGANVAPGSRDEEPSARKPSQVKRTLVRIRVDWSWPREAEADNLLTNETSPERDAAGEFEDDVAENTGLSAKRQVWLRQMFGATDSEYSKFHLQVGSAASRGDDFENVSDVESDLETSAAPRDGSSRVDSGQYENEGRSDSRQPSPIPRKPQVDWFPEVTSGKFLYFDGKDWRDSFVPTDAEPLPWAVRLEYSVDADRYPVPIDFTEQSSNWSAEAEDSLPEFQFESSTSTNESNFGAGIARTVQPPEYPQAVVWTYRVQASRTGAGADLEFDTNFSDGSAATGLVDTPLSEDVEGFEEAFRSSNSVDRGEP